MVRPILVLAGCVCGFACFGMLAGALPRQAVEVRAATPPGAKSVQRGASIAVPVAEEGSPTAAVPDARREAVLAGSAEVVPPAHALFRQRLETGSAHGHAPFARDELVRTFTARDDGSAAPGACTSFLDLDGDGSEEGIAVVGDGWWGRHFDLCHFVPTPAGFVLAAHQRFDHVTRGTPVVRSLSAPRAGFVALLCHDGWGTGYQTTCMRVVEAAGAGLVEVATIPHAGEIVCGGTGPVLEYACTSAAIVAAASGSALLLETTHRIDLTTEGFGAAMDAATVEFEARWAQPAAGRSFVLAVSGGFPAVDQDAFWCLGTRAWIAQHAEAVRRLPRLDEAQLRQLHRICDMAEERGPCPEAAALRAAIPPPPVR